MTKRAKPTASSRTLPNGRNKHEPFVMMPRHVVRSPAYRSLSCEARALLLELKDLHNGRNNGELHMSVRQAQKRLGVGRKRAEKALDELQDRGFIAVVRKGSFTCKVQLATTWRLTEHECQGQPATKDFMRWTAPPKNTVLSGNTDDAPEEHRGPSGPGTKPRHGAPQGHRERSDRRADGAPQEHAVNLPSRDGRPACSGTPAPPVRRPRTPSRRRSREADQLDLIDHLGEPPPSPSADPVLFGSTVREARRSRP